MQLNSNLKRKSLIVVNDIRPTPLLTAILLSKRLNNGLLISHKSIFMYQEYGNKATLVWGIIAWVILKSFHSTKFLCLSDEENSQLEENEKRGLESSLFSITNDSNANASKYPKTFKGLKSLISGTRSIKNLLIKYEEQDINIFIFNGRTASSYSIIKYCFERKIPVIYYEFAAHCNGFRLFPVPPHASAQLGEFLIHYYQKGLFSPFQCAEAADYFEMEKLNSEYAKKNKSNPQMKNDIVIFLGSDYEYTCVDEEICGVRWLGNKEFCLKVIFKYGIDRQYCIRCHPNSAKDPNWPALLEELNLALAGSKANYTLIAPNQKIDSHKLIREANLVATDLSTIAQDAIIIGTEVDIFGNTEIRRVQNDEWFKRKLKDDLSCSPMEPHALWPNFFVFRFPLSYKIAAKVLYYVHRFFEKTTEKLFKFPIF